MAFKRSPTLKGPLNFDFLKPQKRKPKQESDPCAPVIDDITSLIKNLKLDKEMKDPYAWLNSLIKSSSLQDQQKGVIKVRKLLAVETNHPTQALVDVGVVPFLIKMIKTIDDADIHFESCWALTNISAGNTTQTHAVITGGAIPVLIRLLDSPHANVREQAVWCLGNIAGESANCRDEVLNAGILGKVATLIKTAGNVQFARVISWALSNLCGSTPQAPFATTRNFLPSLVDLLKTPDTQCIADACWALFHISREVHPPIISAILQSGAVSRLVEILSKFDATVKHPALKTLGNICCGSHNQTQTVLEHNLLTNLKRLLHDSSKAVRREACWTLSNITAGTIGQIEEVVSHKLIGPLVVLARDDHSDVKEEAAWALSNAVTGGKDVHILYLAEQEPNFVDALCSLLVQVNDQRTLSMLLTAIECILSAAMRKDDIARYQKKLFDIGCVKTLSQLHNFYSDSPKADGQKVATKALRIKNRLICSRFGISRTSSRKWFSKGACLDL